MWNSADTTNLKFGHLEIKGGCQVTVIKRLDKSMCLEVKSAQVEHQYKATFYKGTVQGESALTFCFQENDKYYIPEVKDKTLTVSAYDDESKLKKDITTSNYFKWTKGDDGDWRKVQSLEAPSMYLGLDEEKRIILFNPDGKDTKKVPYFLFKEN